MDDAKAWSLKTIDRREAKFSEELRHLREQIR